MNDSDDEQFEDTYKGIAADEAVETLEVEDAAVIRSEVVEKVEEPAVESRPVGLSRSSKKSRPFEAVPEKSSKS